MAEEVGVDKPRRPALLIAPAVIGAIAALLYGNFLLDWVLRGFHGMGAVVSSLEAPGASNSDLLRVTDVICAGLVACLLPQVRARLPRGTWREIFVGATFVFAIGAALAAVVVTPCLPGVSCVGPGQRLATDAHDYLSVVSDTALYAGAAAVWFSTRTAGPVWFRRAAWWAFWLAGVVSTIVFGYFHQTADPTWAIGLSQRVHIVGISAWIFCLGLLAAQPVETRLKPGPVSWSA